MSADSTLTARFLANIKHGAGVMLKSLSCTELLSDVYTLIVLCASNHFSKYVTKQTRHWNCFASQTSNPLDQQRSWLLAAIAYRTHTALHDMQQLYLHWTFTNLKSSKDIIAANALSPLLPPHISCNTDIATHVASLSEINVESARGSCTWETIFDALSVATTMRRFNS